MSILEESDKKVNLIPEWRRRLHTLLFVLCRGRSVFRSQQQLALKPGFSDSTLPIFDMQNGQENKAKVWAEAGMPGLAPKFAV